MIDSTKFLTLAVIALAATVIAPPEASACGGLVCDGGGPAAVVQNAERIVFAKNPDGTTTAVVQIQYSGPTDQFGWLLPVPGIPEVGLGSDHVFTRLQAATDPSYSLTTEVEGKCKNPVSFSLGGGRAASDSAGANNGAFEEGSDNPISVLDSGAVGPYDYVILEVDTATGGNAQLALDWLEANGYQPPDTAPDLIEPYFEDGFNMLAIRLQKSSDTGSIRPIKLTYDSSHPMIPIKLTALAASPDMGVMVWVLGPHRAVPLNYKALEINDALINWFNPMPTYNDVINQAADEASGQGFVTEWATADGLDDQLFLPSEDDAWTALKADADAFQDSELLDRAFQFYGSWNGWDAAVDAALPALSAQDRASVQQCGACVAIGDYPENFSEEFVDALDTFVVGPAMQMQEMFDEAAYATRLYTTMSATDMTIDPSFGFNEDLPDVDNVHTATRYIECSKKYEQFEAPWRVELPSGLVVRGEGNNGWPVQLEDGGMMPATLTVAEVGESGKPNIVRNNIEAIQTQLEKVNALAPTSGCGCATGTVPTDASPLLLLLGLFGLRRRRN